MTKPKKLTRKQAAENLQHRSESKSSQIRYLTKCGWTRRQIADEVKVIYQFVYNVQNQKTK